MGFDGFSACWDVFYCFAEMAETDDAAYKQAVMEYYKMIYGQYETFLAKMRREPWGSVVLDAVGSAAEGDFLLLERVRAEVAHWRNEWLAMNHEKVDDKLSSNAVIEAAAMSSCHLGALASIIIRPDIKRSPPAWLQKVTEKLAAIKGEQNISRCGYKECYCGCNGLALQLPGNRCCSNL